MQIKKVKIKPLYTRTIITPCLIKDIHLGERDYCVRYCKLVDGKAVPAYIHAKTWYEALLAVNHARMEQGFEPVQLPKIHGGV
jgi:hypothetical protein